MAQKIKPCVVCYRENIFIESSENDGTMWSLIMGVSYSSEEEGGDPVARVTEQLDNVIHKPREEGDGMERPPVAGVLSDNNSEDCDKSEKCDIEEAGAEQKPDSDKSSIEANQSINNMNSPQKFIEVFYKSKVIPLTSALYGLPKSIFLICWTMDNLYPHF